MHVLWRIAKLAFAYHGENKYFGDLFCQIRIKEDGHVSNEYFELGEDSNLSGRKIYIIHFRWMIAQVVKMRTPKIVLLKGFKIFFSELFFHEEGVMEYYRYQLLHLNFFDGHEKYILSLH